MNCKILNPERTCVVCGRLWRDGIGERRSCSRTCDERRREQLVVAIRKAKERRAVRLPLLIP